MSGGYLPDDTEFYVTLPRNVQVPGATTENKPWSFETPLTQALNFKDLNSWMVAATQVILPTVPKNQESQIFFLYSDLVQPTWVGNSNSALLCWSEVKRSHHTGYTIHEPMHPMYHALGSDYIDKIWIEVRDERGNYLVTSELASTTVTLHFVHQSITMGERFLVLPSNSSLERWPDNGPNLFTITLPDSLSYTPDEWEVALTSLQFPSLERPTEADDDNKQDRRFGLTLFNTETNVMENTWMHPLDRQWYNTYQELIDEINKKLDRIVGAAWPDVHMDQGGGLVHEGNNRIRWTQIEYNLESRESTVVTQYDTRIPPGNYMWWELVDAINAIAPRNAEGELMLAVGTIDKEDEKEYVRFKQYAHSIYDPTGKKIIAIRFYSFDYFGLDGSTTVRRFLNYHIPKPKNGKGTRFFKVRAVKEGRDKIRLQIITLYTPFWRNTKYLTLVATKPFLKLLGMDKQTGEVPDAHYWERNDTAPDYYHLKRDDPFRATSVPFDPTDETFVIWTDSDAPLHWIKPNAVVESGLYIYTDICRSSMVGNTNTPLLAVVPFTGPEGRHTYEFKHLSYHPLRLSVFNGITTTIMVGYGTLVRGMRNGTVLLRHPSPPPAAAAAVPSPVVAQPAPPRVIEVMRMPRHAPRPPPPKRRAPPKAVKRRYTGVTRPVSHKRKRSTPAAIKSRRNVELLDEYSDDEEGPVRYVQKRRPERFDLGKATFNPASFSVPPQTGFIDLSQLFFELGIKLVTPTGADLTEKTLDIGVVNNISHSIIKRIDMKLNNVSISEPTDMYHIKAMVESMLNYTQEQKDTMLAGEGWYGDTPGPATVIDSVTPWGSFKGGAPPAATAYNEGLTERSKLFFTKWDEAGTKTRDAFFRMEPKTDFFKSARMLCTS
ncbi:hypothetical protein AC249_AIPGENE24569 [Exaiptasia diaphana]|nr:hypothetical protein AC249_AIPGENE24569 [Exaiptasia diaphana]